MNNIFRSFAAIVFLALCGAVAFELFPEKREILDDGVLRDAEKDPTVEFVGSLPRLNVLYASNAHTLYGMEDHYLFRSKDGGKTFRRLGKLPKPDSDFISKLKDAIARTKLVRLVRKNPGPNNLVVLESGTILVFWDQIYRSDDEGLSFEVVYSLGAETAYPPFSYSEGVAVGPGDEVYFGEYLTTKRPHPVRILKGSRDGKQWQVVHTFPSGEIFHVHSIQFDPYRQIYWIATGDRDEESNLYYTEDFSQLIRLGGGSQDWRMVSMIITEEQLYWGSDNDVTGSSIFRWSFRQNHLERLRDIGKPSYYSTRLDDGTLVLSTTYEPESRFTKASAPKPEAELWVSRNGTDWQNILRLPHRADERAWGRSRAAIAFPGGAALENLFVIPISTRPQDFSTSVLRFRP